MTVVGGRNMPASDDAKTTPRPIANGAPIVRNFSDGAHTAMVDNPPTIPAVYQAARTLNIEIIVEISQAHKIILNI